MFIQILKLIACMCDIKTKQNKFCENTQNTDLSCCRFGFLTCMFASPPQRYTLLHKNLSSEVANQKLLLPVESPCDRVAPSEKVCTHCHNSCCWQLLSLSCRPSRMRPRCLASKWSKMLPGLQQLLLETLFTWCLEDSLQNLPSSRNHQDSVKKNPKKVTEQDVKLGVEMKMKIQLPHVNWRTLCSPYPEWPQGISSPKKTTYCTIKKQIQRQ